MLIPALYTRKKIKTYWVITFWVAVAGPAPARLIVYMPGLNAAVPVKLYISVFFLRSGVNINTFFTYGNYHRVFAKVLYIAT